MQTTDKALKPDRSVMFGSLKWNWHRIRKASVLTRPVNNTLPNGRFHVFVREATRVCSSRLGRASAFATGNCAQSLRASPVTSIVEFVIEAIHPHNVDDPQDTANITIVLKNVSLGIDVAPF